MKGEFTKIVPCGKCIKCLARRRNSWAFRLAEESKISHSAAFITLTYETPPRTRNGYGTLYKKDYQNFIKRLRKGLPKKNHPSYTQIKYYACGEYGTDTKRPHYHAIMFNLPQSYISNPVKLADTWNLGHIDIAPCNTATIRYVTGYLMKGGLETFPDIIDYSTGEIIEDDRNKEFSLMSKQMGSNYLSPQMIKYHKERLVSFVTLPGGVPTVLPRYFRDKIFNKQERQIMNESAEMARNIDFKKLFNNSFSYEIQWKKQQINHAEKQQKLERQTL